MFRLMTVPPCIVGGPVRWGCRYAHEDWSEEPGDNSKDNSLTWSKSNKSHDFHVAKGSLFRKYSWSCSHFNSELLSRLFAQVIGEGRQFDHNSEKKGVYWKLTSIQTSGHPWSTRPSCRHGVEHSCTQGRKCVLPERLKDISFTSSTRRTISCVETSMDSECPAATNLTSAVTDSRIYSFMNTMTLYMCIVAITIFLSIPPSFSSVVVTMSTSRPTGVCRINRWTKNSAEHAERIWNYYFESLAFSRHSVDLQFDEEVMEPERFTDATDHAGFLTR